jgi:hypothetical protein
MSDAVIKPSYNCFVIMPFAKTTHGKGRAAETIDAKQWGHIYDQWIFKAVESFESAVVTCKRSPASPGNFIKGIVQDLEHSDFVIADLTGGRPNVYYELGIRHALKTGTLIITQDFSALPTDLQSYYCFEYQYTNEAHLYEESFAAFKRDLHDKMHFLVKESFPPDNPVSDFLGYRDSQQSQEFLARKEKIVTLLRKLLSTITSLTKLESLDGLNKDNNDFRKHYLASIPFRSIMTAIHTNLSVEMDWTGFPSTLVAETLELSQVAHLYFESFSIFFLFGAGPDEAANKIVSGFRQGLLKIAPIERLIATFNAVDRPVPANG